MQRPNISMIVAMDEKRGIGLNNEIPWHIKKDLVRLKELTKDNLVILGRTSYESMAGYYDKSGRTMPAKEYIVLTHDKNFKSSRGNTFAAGSVDEAIEHVAESGSGEAFVIGGQTIFEQFMPYTQKIFLTIVKGDFGCDTFFPETPGFKEVKSEESEENGTVFNFKTLVR